MRIATFQGETELSKLVSRFYVIRGTGAKARAKEAEAALLRANPHLENLDGVQKGAVLIVPQVTDAEWTDASRLGGIFSDEALAELHRLTQAAKDLLQHAHEQQADALHRTLELLKAPQFKALAKQEPDVSQTLTAVNEESKLALKENQASQTAHKQAMLQLRKDLDRLGALIS